MNMRKGCRTSKNEKKCEYYSYSLLRCELGHVPATCVKIKQPKPDSAAGRRATEVRNFYKSNFTPQNFEIKSKKKPK